MIIGIGGCSSSGKSTLAKTLAAQKSSPKILSLDDYTFPENNLPIVGNRYNWEIPEAYDFDRLLQDINGNRSDCLFVEGILVFYDPRVVALLDTKIFISIEKDTFFRRRKLETRWGNEPDWFLEYVWASYTNYGQIKLDDNYVVISGENKNHLESLTTEIDRYKII